MNTFAVQLQYINQICIVFTVNITNTFVVPLICPFLEQNDFNVQNTKIASDSFFFLFFLFFLTTLLRVVLQYLVELKELLNLQSYFKSIVTFGLGLKSKLGTSFGLLSKRSLNSRYFYEMSKYIKLQNNHHRLYIHTIIIRKV